MHRQTRKNHFSPTEQLELRVLPTVNVVFNAGSGLLKITGDSADNRIDIDGLATPGSLEVFVNNTLFDDFAGVKSIKVTLKDGDDTLFMSVVKIPGNLTVNLGDGADEIDIDGGINLGTGPDGVGNIGGFVKANLGGDVDDNLDFDDGIVFSGNALFSGVADADLNGDGTNFQVQNADDITFLSNLTIKFSGFGDKNGDDLELDFDNVNVQGTTTLDGSNDIERFEFTNCSFGDFNADMDDGDDFININNGAALKNSFLAQANFRGGDDNDTLLKGLDNLFAQPELVDDFETVI